MGKELLARLPIGGGDTTLFRLTPTSIQYFINNEWVTIQLPHDRVLVDNNTIKQDDNQVLYVPDKLPKPEEEGQVLSYMSKEIQWNKPVETEYTEGLIKENNTVKVDKESLLKDVVKYDNSKLHINETDLTVSSPLKLEDNNISISINTLPLADKEGKILMSTDKGQTWVEKIDKKNLPEEYITEDYLNRKEFITKDSIEASNLAIVDDLNYYQIDNIEAALQQIANELTNLGKRVSTIEQYLAKLG